MLSTCLRYVLNSLPVVSYVILLSFSYSFILYICGRVSLTFAGIYLVGAYATVSLGMALMGNNMSFAGFIGILLLACFLGAAMLVASYLCFERFLKTDVHRMVATSSLLVASRGLVKVIWGTTPVTYSAPFLSMGVSEIAGNIVPNYYLFMLAVALLLMLTLSYFLNRTCWGMRFRASSLDGERTMAQACGGNQNVATLMTFAIAGVLAGLAGGLYAPIAGAAYGSEGNALLLAALSVIIGGVGSIGGAVLAAFIVGIARAVAAIKMPVLELAVPFIIASITLMLRPFGIWGKEFRY